MRGWFSIALPRRPLPISQHYLFPFVMTRTLVVWLGGDDLPSTTHSKDTLCVSKTPQKFTLHSDDEQSVSSTSCGGLSRSQDFAPSISPKSHLTTQNELHDLIRAAPINSRLNVVVRSPTLFGLGQNGCWPSRGPQLPRALPFIFSLCCPLNDRRRAAHSIFKIGRLFSLFLFLFSCPSLALLRLLNLLLLLMSGNVHPNPGPIFPCSVCDGNVTWQGKSVQWCACSKWVYLGCSQLSLSKFRTLGAAPSAVTL